jgi:DNA sulfur modification protein DndC
MYSANSKGKSIFESRSPDGIYEEIRQVYLGYSYPWGIGYSGGKDSTTTLQYN